MEANRLETKEIEIEILVRSGRELELARSSKFYIYKVPGSLRKGNPEAYTPQLISIGPIHRDQEKLKPMEDQKVIYFAYFWERLSNKSESRASFLKYKDFVKNSEEEIRQCYSENYPEIKTVQFVDMIVFDTVFIMELFLRESDRSKYKDDPMITKSWLKKSIQRDLLLLENQLPIFLLHRLYETVVPADYKGQHSNFLCLAREYFAFCDPQKASKEIKISDPQMVSEETTISDAQKSSEETTLISDPQEVPEETTIKQKELWEELRHFTDLIRQLHIPPDLVMKGNPRDLGNDDALTARKLKEVGISFEKVSNKCLLDIKFKKSFFNWFLCLGCFPCLKCVKARLQLPQLTVDDRTECVLRNLIALEQCHYPDHQYICNYVLLLGYLIQNEEDVDLLVEDKVIVNKSSSHKEMATLVNSLGKHVVITYLCYDEIIDELNEHYRCRWKRSMGKLSWVYFRDLWRSSLTIVGIVVFLFAVVSFLDTVD